MRNLLLTFLFLTAYIESGCSEQKRNVENEQFNYSTQCNDVISWGIISSGISLDKIISISRCGSIAYKDTHGEVFVWKSNTGEIVSVDFDGDDFYISDDEKWLVFKSSTESKALNIDTGEFYRSTSTGSYLPGVTGDGVLYPWSPIYPTVFGKCGNGQLIFDGTPTVWLESEIGQSLAYEGKCTDLWRQHRSISLNVDGSSSQFSIVAIDLMKSRVSHFETFNMSALEKAFGVRHRSTHISDDIDVIIVGAATPPGLCEPFQKERAFVVRNSGSQEILDVYEINIGCSDQHTKVIVERDGFAISTEQESIWYLGNKNIGKVSGRITAVLDRHILVENPAGKYTIFNDDLELSLSFADAVDLRAFGDRQGVAWLQRTENMEQVFAYRLGTSTPLLVHQQESTGEIEIGSSNSDGVILSILGRRGQQVGFFPFDASPTLFAQNIFEELVFGREREKQLLVSGITINNKHILFSFGSSGEQILAEGQRVNALFDNNAGYFAAYATDAQGITHLLGGDWAQKVLE